MGLGIDEFSPRIKAGSFVNPLVGMSEGTVERQDVNENEATVRNMKGSGRMVIGPEGYGWDSDCSSSRHFLISGVTIFS